jgi:MFS family permease
MLGWYRESSRTERRTFWACFGGWTLDSLDLQLFTLVIPTLIATWSITKGDAGLITAGGQIAAAIGGWIAGWASDRYGRVRVLQATILWFSLATFAIGFTQNFEQLLVARIIQGFGFGGEWAAGAVLMAEVIRPQHRGKALSAVQSGWAVGWGAAVIAAGIAFSIAPEAESWRWLFFIGLLPALLVLFLRRGISDPPVYAASRKLLDGSALRVGFAGIFSRDLWRTTMMGALLGVGSHGGYYALMTFLPTFLRTERKLSVLSSSGYLGVLIVGSFLGYVLSGYVSDRLGRRRTFLLYGVCCLITLTVYLFAPITNAQMLFLGAPLGFFASGIPATMGSFFSELFPTALRGTGQGFCYNAGRVLSATFPAMVGYMSAHTSLGTAIGTFSFLAYTMVVLCAFALPETRGRVFSPATS